MWILKDLAGVSHSPEMQDKKTSFELTRLFLLDTRNVFGLSRQNPSGAAICIRNPASCLKQGKATKKGGRNFIPAPPFEDLQMSGGQIS